MWGQTGRFRVESGYSLLASGQRAAGPWVVSSEVTFDLMPHARRCPNCKEGQPRGGVLSWPQRSSSLWAHADHIAAPVPYRRVLFSLEHDELGLGRVICK